MRCSCTTSFGGDPFTLYAKQLTLPAILLGFLLWEYMVAGLGAIDSEDKRVVDTPASIKNSQDLALIRCGTWRAFWAASSNKDR